MSRLRWPLTIVGTTLVWLPIVAPVVLTAIVTVVRGELLFDWLMPAELFGLALVGGLLLLVFGARNRRQRFAVGVLLGGAIGLLAGSQGLAVVTGLAHGSYEPTGWRLAVVLTPYVLFVAAIAGLGVVGIGLVRRIQSDLVS